MKNWETVDLSAALEAAIAAQFALFSIVALLKAREGASTLYFLAAVTGLIALMVGGNFLAAAMPGFHWVNTANLGMELLIGPGVYLYIRQARLVPVPLKIKDILHAAPALPGMVMVTASIGRIDTYVVAVMFAYFAASGRLLWRERSTYPLSFRGFASVVIILFALAAVLRIAIAADPDVAAGFRGTTAYPILLGVVLLAAWFVQFVALRWPEIVSAASPARKYVRSGLGERELAAVKVRLASVLEEERPYLEADLTLENLARRVGAAPRHVSQLINSEYGMNFSAYMNFLRVAQAAQKLAAETLATPIKTIMYDTGFRSKSVFNREFRRVHGATPSEYRRRASIENP